MAKSITLKGFDAYAKRLKNAPSKLLQEADLEASAAAINIEKDAKNRAPHDLGALRASINHAKLGEGHYEVTASVNYAAYVEFGTRSRVDVPPDLTEYALQFKRSDGSGLGMAARPYLFPSVDAEEPNFIKRLKEVLNDL